MARCKNIVSTYLLKKIWYNLYNSIMSISGSGTISTLLNGLIWTSYNDYFNLNVNFFSTATKLAGTNGAYTGTSSDFTNTSTATNGNWSDAGATPHFFSIQWIGYFLAPVTGTYNWGCRSDDGAYLWIGTNAVTGYTTGNALLYSNNSTVGPTSISLTAGVFYPIRIQYGDYNGPNNYYLYFTLPGSSTPIYNGTGYYFNDVRPFIVNPSSAVTTMISFDSQKIITNVAATPQAFNTLGSSNTITVSSYTGSNTFQNGTYIASASSVSEGKQAWNMFYGAISKSIASDYWHCAYAPTQGGYANAPYNGSGVYVGGGTGFFQSTIVQVAGTINGEWVQIKIPYSLKLTSYSLYPRGGTNWSTRWPTQLYVVGSNDGSTWYQLDSRSIPSSPGATTNPLTYTLTEPNSYNYFRVITNTVNAGNPVIHYGDWTLIGSVLL